MLFSESVNCPRYRRSVIIKSNLEKTSAGIQFHNTVEIGYVIIDVNFTRVVPGCAYMFTCLSAQVF